MGWLGRYLVKRAAWALLVGIVGVVWALVSSGAVRAATFTLPTGLVDGGSNSGAWFAWGSPVTVVAGSVTFSGTFTNTGHGQSWFRLDCSPGAGEGVSNGFSGGTFTLTATSVPDGTACQAYVSPGPSSNLNVTAAQIVDSSPDPTPTPTPTDEPTPTPTEEPTEPPDPICTPYCLVALSDADRARLDYLNDAVDFGAGATVAFAGVAVFLLAVVAVTTGLRR